MVRKITPKMLRDAGACSDQVALFAAIWPKGAVPTAARMKRARRKGLDTGWLFSLLRDATWAEYDKVRDAALAGYDKVRDAALAGYDKVRDLAFCRIWAEASHD